MNENSIKVVLIAVAVLLMGLLVAQIRRRTRRFLNSAEVCLLRELVRSAQAGELQQEDQPKSLSGMTSIYLPQILRDLGRTAGSSGSKGTAFSGGAECGDCRRNPDSQNGDQPVSEVWRYSQYPLRDGSRVLVTGRKRPCVRRRV